MGNRFGGVVFAGIVTAVVVAAPGAAVAAVPPPTASTAVVTVKTGGDRVDDDTVAPLAGVTLGLFPTADASSPIVTCVSDADGDCSFTVAGAALGTSAWVGQVAAPTGWVVNASLRTGPASGSSSVASPYRFETPTLQAGRTYRSTSDFMFSDTNSSPVRSNGVWQQSRVNPGVAARCGSDVAIVMDLSASVGSALPQLKQAADSFADALVGTPSRLAAFSFSRQSPSVEVPSGTVDENRPDLVSVSTRAGADAFESQYAGWGLGSGTNWDRALQQVAASPEHYDAVIVLTDGNPDRWGLTHGDGSNTHFTDVEAAVFSANTLKAAGTRIVSFGVGAGVSGVSALNLAAISGPTAFTGDNAAAADYFQTSDYTGAATQLRDLALANCSGSLSVVKQIVPGDTTGDDTTGAAPAGAGWTFDATAATTGTVIDRPSATTSDDGTGSVSFALTPPAGAASSAVQVAERQRPGYTLVPQGGQNATCTDLNTGATVPTGAGGATGFTVDVPAASAVSCVVYNRAPAPPTAAAVTVTKTWVVNDVSYADGQQPDGLRAELELSGPDSPTLTPQPFGQPRDGYQTGDAVTIGERTSITDSTCTLDRSALLDDRGGSVSTAVPATVTLAAAQNVYQLRNTVTCATVTPTPSPTSTAPAPGTIGGGGGGSAAHPGGLAFTGVDEGTLLLSAASAVGAVLLGMLLLARSARRRHRR